MQAKPIFDFQGCFQRLHSFNDRAKAASGKLPPQKADISFP
jgi:hypothetical protein